MFEFNLQTAVFFGTVALGGLLFVLAILALVGATMLLGAIRSVHRSADVATDRWARRSQAAR
ncbi:hypothetical protein [Sinomonas mesophila]|uniref:hypothetical protein n=1 Tax=Sinomonas mesophila TaxID=1531955 RepID=UPI0009849453|nr:hypothetical protein [Sinomonas mesophila]